MSGTTPKPLNWHPDPEIGYSVTRRDDGGMTIVFTNLSHATLKHWHEFSIQHLLDSDRLTRNLYDLRQIKEVSEEAIQFAVEVNNDPSVRNIRLAVVVSNEAVNRAIHEIAALTTPGGVEMGIFWDIDEAETWLSRPLEYLV